MNLAADKAGFGTCVATEISHDENSSTGTSTRELRDQNRQISLRYLSRNEFFSCHFVPPSNILAQLSGEEVL